MNKKILIISYIITLAICVIIFLNVSKTKYCLNYQGHTEFIGDIEVYITGLDNSITKECFNNIQERDNRYKKIKEYTDIYLPQIPNYLINNLS